MKEAILDALKDTLITFFVIFILYVLISFVETKLTNKFKKATKYKPNEWIFKSNLIIFII